MAGTDFSHLTNDELIKGIKALDLPDYIRSKAYGIDVRETLAQMTEMTIQLGVNMGLSPDDALLWARKLQETVSQSEFDSWVATLLDGGPSIFMNTLSELQTTYPNGAAGVALVRETDPAKIYVWNGTAWEDFGDYQGIEIKDGTVTSEKIVDGAVTHQKTNFIVTGINLFNPRTRSIGEYIDGRGDHGKDNPNYDLSDFIKVNQNTVYRKGSTHGVGFFNDDMELLDANSGTHVFTTPPYCEYIRVTVPKDALDKYMVHEGESELPWEPFQYEVKTKDGTDIFATPTPHTVGNKEIIEESVSYDKTNFMKVGKNLFNKNRVVEGLISDITGIVSDSDLFYTSEFIPVKPNSPYTKNYPQRAVFFDEYMNILGKISGDDNLTFTTPKKTRFVRVAVDRFNLNTYQLEEGTNHTQYEDYKLGLDKSMVFDPTNNPQGVPLNDLVAWFKADDLKNVNDLGLVKEWRDASQNGMTVFAPSDSNAPTFLRDTYNGLPTVKFESKQVEEKWIDNRLESAEKHKILNRSYGAHVFIVAEKDVNVTDSQFSTPVLFTTDEKSNAFLRFDISKKLSIHGRLKAEDELTNSIRSKHGLSDAPSHLSLYEAWISYSLGEIRVYQDGDFVETLPFTAGLTETEMASYVVLGGRTFPNNTIKTGFNGNISEIMVYRYALPQYQRSMVSNYLMEKWGIDGLDDVYSAKYKTTVLNNDISESSKNLSLISVKQDYDLESPDSGRVPQGYLYLQEDTQKLYYSSGDHTKPEYLFDWDDSLTGLSCDNYIPYISKNGDIIFVRIRSRGNPIVYPSGDFENPVVIDFSGEDAPTAGLMDSGAEWDYENNFLMIAEYRNPVTDGEMQSVWKISYPFTDKSNWKKTLQIESKMVYAGAVDADTIRHFHTLKRDFYTGAWYANTGDNGEQCKTFESLDDGEIWTQVGGGSQSDRMTGLLFLEDGAYWGTDSHADHALYHAPRKPDGYCDFANYDRVTWLSIMQPTYQTAYLRNPHGILLLDRSEERDDFELDLTFWSFDKNRLYRVDVLKPIPEVYDGSTGEREGRFGFGNQAVTSYQPINADGIIMGATKNWLCRPMTVDLLGNSIDNRLGNLEIEVLEKGK